MGGAEVTTSALEVERKYDVGPGTPVPDLAGVQGVTSTAPAEEHLLEAMYVDTPDLRLRSAGITLRHRTGGTDAGWHLKLPAGADREEIRVQSDAGDVPAELASLVRVHVRGRDLVPVASLSTRRVVQRLLGPDGAPLAEFADDTVHGRPLPDGAELLWREWEVELLGGGRTLLDAVQVQLLAAGAAPSSSSSKLGRVLSRPQAVDGEQPWWADGGRRGGRRTAGATVQAHLAGQVAELVARDPQVRRDLPDALHRMRVATRRLRSALTTFGPLLNRELTDPLRDELRWLAAVLGAARDAEVMRARLLALIDAERADLVLGDVREHVDAAMARRHRVAHDQVVVELDGERYLRLLDDLDALVAAPPFLPGAREDAKSVLADLVRRSWRRLDRAMAAAERAPRGLRQDELLHEVRKDAKRTRYAAEAVEPVFGRPARRYAAAVTQLQESLGDFQDGAVTRQVLLEIAAAGQPAGENAFTLGRLHAREQALAEAAVADWPLARVAVSRKRFRGWFKS